MTAVPTAGDGGAAVAPGAPDLGAARARASVLTSSDAAGAVGAFLFSFVLLFMLSVNSAGYWPTAWSWMTLALLFLCAVILILRTDVRIGRFELVFPGSLLGLTVWGFVSVAWSASATQPMLQSQRTLAYTAAALAALLVVRGRAYRPLLGGVWAAIIVCCLYSLATRLFPDRLGVDDAFGEYRLAAPLGYWNALGIFAVIGTLLAIGFAARARSAVARALAAASTVVLVTTLYFTFSRGSWIALAVALVTLVILDSHRLQLVTTVAVVAPWPALAVWYASGFGPLTRVDHTLEAATQAGHRVAGSLAALAFAAAAVMLVYDAVERRVRVPTAVRRVYGALLLLVVVAGIVTVSERYGSPPTIVRNAYDAFVGPRRSVDKTGDLNYRLFSFGSGRVELFRVAWSEYTAHPRLGSGAGSYERYWHQQRPIEGKARNAHSLYLETLAELGPVGLGLLVIALAAPLAAALRARRRALVPAATAAYVALLVHAAVDWDWQMPAVTVAALFCGAALLVAARRTPWPVLPMRALWRIVALGLVVVLGAVTFVGLRGNRAIAASQHAASHLNWPRSTAEARSARFWAPWSSRPWQLLGEAQAAAGDRAAARASFEQALAKDRTDWSIWLDLAVASTGAEQRRAFAAALKLNPRSPEIAGRLPGARVDG